MKPRVIAFYLPQFHPTPENDEWWGKGFTEWTNVAKARPLYLGHYQPKIPTDLGYYDLRVSETREAQAELAKDAGIEGFCYWHYWFGNGKRLLERPFNEVLQSGKPDFPFCLGWANHSWYKKTWQPGNNGKLLIEQKYHGVSDIDDHFFSQLNAFKDKRYLKVNDKPIFLIWDPLNLPNANEFIDRWNRLAQENNLNGIFFIGFSVKSSNSQMIKNLGFDEVVLDLLSESFFYRHSLKKVYQRLLRHLFGVPKFLSYNDYANYSRKIYNTLEDCCPCIVPNFDHTSRSGRLGLELRNSTPENFGRLFEGIINSPNFKNSKNKILFIKSWNEWGEGNYLEPDIKFKDGYLNIIKKNILL